MFKKIPLDAMSVERRKLLFGVGVNDANYQIKPIINGKNVCCIFYQRWVVMLQRCYSQEYQNRFPTYKGCAVCDEWLIFSGFKKWMEKQDWKGKQLDKDIVITGNKIYSPNTCIFVSHKINYLIVDQKKSRGKYPKGVYKRDKFIAQCNVNGKKKYIGRFNSAKEAGAAYIKFKIKLILGVAQSQQSPLKEYLIRISKELKQESK